MRRKALVAVEFRWETADAVKGAAMDACFRLQRSRRSCSMTTHDPRFRFMSQTSGLTVRQHERSGIEMPVELEVCEAHASQVMFSSSSSAAGQHVIRGKAIDISPGGMGIESRQFLPRMVEGTVRVFAPDPNRKNRDGSAALNLVFEQAVKVRRVSQLSREPSYNLGVAFLSAGAEMDQRIAMLLEQTGNAGYRIAGAGGQR